MVKFTDYLTGDPFFSFLGNNKVNETAEALLDFAGDVGASRKLQLVPEASIKKIDPKKFYILENRDHFDYIYHMGDLHKSQGKKYETHRNLLSRFKNRHAQEDVEVKLLPLQAVKKDILRLNETWKNNKKGKVSEIELKNESRAVERIFNVEDKNLIAVCVFHKAELIAYSISELLHDDHALCHFAKGDIAFVGIYSFLMKKTCEALLGFGKNFLNYEQDLGFPHLRHSKAAFQPHIFLNKYSVIST